MRLFIYLGHTTWALPLFDNSGIAGSSAANIMPSSRPIIPEFSHIEHPPREIAGMHLYSRRCSSSPLGVLGTARKSAMKDSIHREYIFERKSCSCHAVHGVASVPSIDLATL